VKQPATRAGHDRRIHTSETQRIHQHRQSVRPPFILAELNTAYDYILEGCRHNGVEHLKRDVGFEPKTPLADGIGRWADWYRRYHGL